MTSTGTRPVGQRWIDGAPAPVQRVMYGLRPRVAEVVRVRRVTPRMARVTLTGDFDELPGAAATDHVKVFFPAPGDELPVMPQIGERGLVPPPPGTPRNYRDYTVRRLDRAGSEMDLDMVVHAGGLAGTWAATARPGLKVGVLGPRASEIVTGDLDWYVLAGDETAMPAVGRWLAELPAGASAQVFLEVADAGEEQDLGAPEGVELRWLHRDGTPPGESTLLVDAVAALDRPEGAVFAWVAAESATVRAVRADLRGRWGLSRSEHHAIGYWRRGRAMSPAG